MRREKFTFHTDPGHGWLEVTLADMLAVGLEPHSFSRYSYRKGPLFFLEEDCDASKFVAAYERVYGCKPEFCDSYKERTPIRNFPSIVV